MTKPLNSRPPNSFHEAFMTHTSTSPNYQIVASLDVGRRQTELEGYELVEQTIGLAMTLRQVGSDEQPGRWLATSLCCVPPHMIPELSIGQSGT